MGRVPVPRPLAFALRSSEEDRLGASRTDGGRGRGWRERVEGRRRDIRAPFQIRDERRVLEGIPEFWLTPLGNRVELSDAITGKDAEVLKRLGGINPSYLPTSEHSPGYKLTPRTASSRTRQPRRRTSTGMSLATAVTSFTSALSVRRSSGSRRRRA
jgi:hypothetical protein